MSAVTLVTGGARSGKSAFALQAAMARKRRAFIATATVTDGEMADRIGKHRRERGNDFLTIEEPLDPARAIAALPPGTEIAIVDCMAVWTANLMHKYGEERDSFDEIARYLACLEKPPCDLVVVTNEVGMGIVPANALSRRFRDILGGLNREIARRADSVILMVCGLPMKLKGN